LLAISLSGSRLKGRCRLQSVLCKRDRWPRQFTALLGDRFLPEQASQRNGVSRVKTFPNSVWEREAESGSRGRRPRLQLQPIVQILRQRTRPIALVVDA